MSSKESVLVLITGASQGIGAAIAKCFADSDLPFRLALVARNEEALRAVKASCSNAADVQIFPSDVSDEHLVASLAQDIEAAMGDVHVLINNAGSWLGASVIDTPVEAFDRIISANLRSTFLMTQAFLPAMIKAQKGDIFNMSSTAGLEGYAGTAVYCAAKHGVAGFSKALREEVREHNIRVCCVYPGPTNSPSWDGAEVQKSHLMPAQDVAAAFLNAYKLSAHVVTEDIVLRPVVGHFTS